MKATEDCVAVLLSSHSCRCLLTPRIPSLARALSLSRASWTGTIYSSLCIGTMGSPSIILLQWRITHLVVERAVDEEAKAVCYLPFLPDPDPDAMLF